MKIRTELQQSFLDSLNDDLSTYESLLTNPEDVFRLDVNLYNSEIRKVRLYVESLIQVGIKSSEVNLSLYPHIQKAIEVLKITF